MKNIVFQNRKQSQTGNSRIRPKKSIDPDRLDDRLLQLQEYYCNKIEQAGMAGGESLIKFYLEQTNTIASERLELRKNSNPGSNTAP